MCYILWNAVAMQYRLIKVDLNICRCYAYDSFMSSMLDLDTSIRG